MAETGGIPVGRMVWTFMAACIVASTAQAKYSGGSGTAKDPWRIANKTDLLALAANTQDYAAHFILTGDISLAQQSFPLAVIAPCPHAGPRLEFVGTPFTGTFDGNGHKITDLKIDASMSLGYLGLFGCVAPGGVVKNLSLERVSVNDRLVTAVYVGLLVGFNDGGTITDCSVAGKNIGTIIDCQATGDIDGDRGHHSGGLVGDNGGLIANCRATGNVMRGQFPLDSGGAVGKNSGVIACCCAVGNVAGGEGKPVGGFVGTNDPNGSTLNCYASGNVIGLLTVAGLAGSNAGAIANCYAVGKVSGGGNPLYYPVGGLTAPPDVGGQVVGSFWDMQTTGQSTSIGGTGKTTAEMKTAKTFLDAAWDFTCLWNIVEKQSYPFLRFNPEADLNGDQKVNFKDFARLAANWSKSCAASADPKHPLPTCYLAGDLSYDGKVDARDLWLMSLQWLDSHDQNVVR